MVGPKSPLDYFVPRFPSIILRIRVPCRRRAMRSLSPLSSRVERKERKEQARAIASTRKKKASSTFHVPRRRFRNPLAHQKKKNLFFSSRLCAPPFPRLLVLAPIERFRLPLSRAGTEKKTTRNDARTNNQQATSNQRPPSPSLPTRRQPLRMHLPLRPRPPPPLLPPPRSQTAPPTPTCLTSP